MAVIAGTAQNPSGPTAPPNHVFLITPSDTDQLVNVTSAISFAVAGDIKVVTIGGETVVIPSGALVAGIMHPMKINQVFFTGTAATGIVGYY